MIHIESLTKVFGTRDRAVTALEDVSTRLEPGVWGVVGPNGAGKTTLLGLVLGFLRPTAGSVTVDGLPPRSYVRRHGAAYLPERFRVPDPWPVRSALRAFAALEGLSGAEARRSADRAIDRLGLEDDADRPFGTLSRGLAQRAGLAQALLADRRLVVLDEPAEGLDPLWRIRLRDIIQQLATRSTVLLASHDLAELERIADRVLVLDRGRVRAVLDSRADPDGPFHYRLVVDAHPDAVRVAFPGARPDAEPAGPDPARDDAGGRGGAAGYAITVADPGELSHRLAALLEAGATVHAVVPRAGDLETRVRQRLEDG